jgi:hypothetical protein
MSSWQITRGETRPRIVAETYATATGGSSSDVRAHAARPDACRLTSPRARGEQPRCGAGATIRVFVRSRLRWAYLVIPWPARQPLRPSRAVVRGRRVTADARRRKPMSARTSRWETRAARFARVTRGNLRRAGVGALLARRDRSRQRRSTTNQNAHRVRCLSRTLSRDNSGQCASRGDRPSAPSHDRTEACTGSRAFQGGEWRFEATLALGWRARAVNSGTTSRGLAGAASTC